MPANPTSVQEAREEIARIIYAAMQSVSEAGKRYPWQDGGNSTMQDIARRKADEIRAAVRAERDAEIRGMVEGMRLGTDATIARARVLELLDSGGK